MTSCAAAPAQSIRSAIFPEDYDLRTIARELSRFPVRGESCDYSVFFIPVSKERHSLGQAYEAALGHSASANALVDAEIEETKTSTLLVNEACYRVQGLPARILP